MNSRQTTLSIDGDRFLINGQPTYPGRHYEGRRIEGLLLNSRMVQGVFDDLNAKTRHRWNYPDSDWDADRNTREFIEAMPAWRAAGLTAFTINLQGGSPEGYSKTQPWHNSAFAADGSLVEAYFERLARILDRADELGMAAIVGLFYFGQDNRLESEAAVIRAVDRCTDWLVGQGYRNVLVEIANEADIPHYTHDILKPEREPELIARVRERSAGRLLVSTSMRGGAQPTAGILETSDFVLLHGNGVDSPGGIRRMVEVCRASSAYRGQPVLFNEDDHFDFDAADNNMLAALDCYAGWGYFDYRMQGEGFDEGYQSVPVNWTVSSPRKRGFFGLLAKVTDAS